MLRDFLAGLAELVCIAAYVGAIVALGYGLAPLVHLFH